MNRPICCQDDIILTGCKPLTISPSLIGKENYLELPENITVSLYNTIGTSSFHYNSSVASCILTYSSRTDGAHGHCQTTEGQAYTIENCGERGHVWKQMNMAHIAKTEPAETPSISGDVRTDHSSLISQSNTDNSSVSFSLKVYYTDEFSKVTSDIHGFVTQVLAETNQGYANSFIPIQVELHCLEKATVTEIPDSKNMISNFQNMKSSVSALRGGADAALLLVNQMDHCGVAYEDSVLTGGTLSVSAKHCASGFYSVGHGLAHNFGVGHISGHVIEKGDGSIEYKTIMVEKIPPFEPRINYYSNPDVIYPPTGTPTGTATENSASIIALNRFSISGIGNESELCSSTLPQDCSVANSLPCLRSLWQLRPERARSSDDCKKMCDTRRGCQYWTFALFSRECFIWSFSYDSYYNSRGWRSGPKTCDGSLPVYPCKMEETRFVSSFHSTRAKDVEQCKLDCLSSDFCHSWSFNEISTSNILKCRLYQFQRAQLGWTSGVYGC